MTNLKNGTQRQETAVNDVFDRALGPHLEPVFTNVNEDGETYGEHDNLRDAMRVLLDFPNDSVVITLRTVGG